MVLWTACFGFCLESGLMFSLLSKYLPCLPAFTTTLQKSIQCHCSQFISNKMMRFKLDWCVCSKLPVMQHLPLLVLVASPLAYFVRPSQTYRVMLYCSVSFPIGVLPKHHLHVEGAVLLHHTSGQAVSAVNRTVAAAPTKLEDHILHAG